MKTTNDGLHGLRLRAVPECYAPLPCDCDDCLCDAPRECAECSLEVAMGWRVRVDVIRDGEADSVDVCSQCGSIGILVPDGKPG